VLGGDLLLNSSEVVLIHYCCCGGNAVCLIFLAFACIIIGEELHFTGGLGLSSSVVSTA
jgi:hypothetical protein